MKDKNRMKMIRGYDGSGFYIKKIDNRILIRSNKVSNPFEYMYQLGKAIDKLAKNIPYDQIEVIFDLSPFLKRKTVFSMIYNKDTKILDLDSYKELSEKEFSEN